ncbi:cytochrome c-type biogenesis protein [Sphingomonas sp.]|uniref:cytochrome c-type biogenesis protein n=1 Tax=Sphingomonas sp. TaxID=28214 RepID=UPI002DD63A0E|nr:cytochrome c-type biogenesis protein [Sphingomonas sp.]
MIRRLLPLLLPAFLIAAAPASMADVQLKDARAEAQAKALMETLRCLVCQGQSIADSDADMARDMRSLVRQRIAAGETPEQVRGWLVERYGDYVSYDPPFSGATAALWFTPLLLLVGGIAVARLSFRRRRG